MKFSVWLELATLLKLPLWDQRIVGYLNPALISTHFHQFSRIEHDYTILDF